MTEFERKPVWVKQGAPHFNEHDSRWIINDVLNDGVYVLEDENGMLCAADEKYLIRPKYEPGDVIRVRQDIICFTGKDENWIIEKVDKGAYGDIEYFIVNEKGRTCFVNESEIKGKVKETKTKYKIGDVLHVHDEDLITHLVDRPDENAQEKRDSVDHPSHYKDIVPSIECIEVTQHFNFNRGNVIKYVWRAGAKGSEIEDLRKAKKYLEFEIKRLEEQEDV